MYFKEKAMKSNLIVATIMVASVMLISFDAAAIPCKKCGQLSGDTTIENCLENCTPDADSTPTATPTSTATKKPPTTSPTGTSTQTTPPKEPKPECTVEHEADMKVCVCGTEFERVPPETGPCVLKCTEPGFERFPPETGPCVLKCMECEVRLENGQCDKCGPEPEKADCGAFVEMAKTELKPVKEEYDRKLATLSAHANTLYKFLFACLVLLVVLLGWRIKDAFFGSKPKKPTTNDAFFGS